MKILALDLATKTGFAHSCGQSGTWDFSIGRDESSGMRLLRFECKLAEIHRGVGVELIAFEEVSVASGVKANLNAVKLGAKMQAIVERFCNEVGINHCSRNLNEIKAHAIPPVLGKKTVRDKPAMFEAAKKKWPGREFEDENEVDAAWLLDLVQTEFALTIF